MLFNIFTAAKISQCGSLGNKIQQLSGEGAVEMFVTFDTKKISVLLNFTYGVVLVRISLIYFCSRHRKLKCIRFIKFILLLNVGDSDGNTVVKCGNNDRHYD